MKTIGIVLKNYKTNESSTIYGIRDYLIKYLRKYNVFVMCNPFNFLNSYDLDINKPLIKSCDGIIESVEDKSKNSFWESNGSQSY